MDFEQARKLFVEEFFKGRRQNKVYKDEIFPYSKIRYLDEVFITTEILVSETAKIYTVEQELVDKYVNYIKKQTISPIWVTYGKKLKDGSVIIHWHRKFEVKDGNHRIEAYKKLGLNSIKAIMPQSHYRIYIERTRCQQE